MASLQHLKFLTRTRIQYNLNAGSSTSVESMVGSSISGGPEPIHGGLYKLFYQRMGKISERRGFKKREDQIPL